MQPRAYQLVLIKQQMHSFSAKSDSQQILGVSSGYLKVILHVLIFVPHLLLRMVHQISVRSNRAAQCSLLCVERGYHLHFLSSVQILQLADKNIKVLYDSLIVVIRSEDALIHAFNVDNRMHNILVMIGQYEHLGLSQGRQHVLDYLPDL